MTKVLASFLMLAGIAMSAGTARADISLTLNGGAPTASGANFLYTYTATLTPGSSINSTGQFPVGSPSPNTANFVTLYDVVGYVAGSAASVAFPTISVQTPGITPVTQAPPDTGVINLTFNYTNGLQDATGATGIVLGTLSFLSSSGVTTNAMYYSAATQSDRGAGQIANNTSVVVGPSAVPEPGPIALSLVAAAVCGFGYRVRNRKVSA